MKESKSALQKWKKGLGKTRSGLLKALFGNSGKVDDVFFEELEEALILSDAGVPATEDLLERLTSVVREERIKDREEARLCLKRLIADDLQPESAFPADVGPACLLIVGVNGVGKTTTIGKMAYQYSQEGRNVILAAADTFRAAAAEQLGIWAERAGVPMVRHEEGADPAAVVYDAIASYKARKGDLLLIDTAGRLHNKQNLMNELAKIRRVIARDLPDVPCEVLLVLDACTGQNALSQARSFQECCDLNGVILTKMDGTAKGGVVIAITRELKVPVRFVGVGEGIDDLQPFSPDHFAEALLDLD